MEYIDLNKKTKINFEKSPGNSPLRNTFSTVEMDGELFMAENLNINYFQNGDEIFEAQSNDEWIYCALNQIPAWCHYENNSSNASSLGKLYNGYCLLDKREIAPEGWEIIKKIDIHKYKTLIETIPISGSRSHNGDFHIWNLEPCYFWTFDFAKIDYWSYLRERIKKEGAETYFGNIHWINVKCLYLKTKGAIDLRMNYGEKNNFKMGDGYSIRLKKI